MKKFNIFETMEQAYEAYHATPCFSADEWDEFCDEYVVYVADSGEVAVLDEE